MHTEYFTRKTARGSAFFNREKQQRELKTELASSSSIWLSGERRIGKTSVAEAVCRALKKEYESLGSGVFAWVDCDISSCATSEAVRRKVLHSISMAISQISKPTDEIKLFLSSILSRFDPDISIGGKDVFKLNIKLRPPITMEEPIGEAIKALDELACKLDSKAVIIIDEFQTITEVSKKGDDTIEWDIRSGLQKSDNVAMIFSGSKKRMMEAAFLTKNRALHGMCRRIKMFELPTKGCENQLIRAAHASGFTYDSEALTRVCHLSQGHPRDFAHLALQTFEDAMYSDINPKHINIEVVNGAWDEYIDTIVSDEVSAIIGEKINANKRAEVATIQAIAHTRPRSFRTASFSELVGLSATAIANAVKNLDEQGIIRKTDNGRWQLCEPSYEQALINSSRDHFDTSAIEKVIISNER